MRQGEYLPIVISRLARDPTTSFMVVESPAFIVAGHPHVVKIRKLRSGGEADLVEEVLCMVREANQRNNWFAIYEILVEEAVKDPGLDVQWSRFCIRYAEVSGEKLVAVGHSS